MRCFEGQRQARISIDGDTVRSRLEVVCSVPEKRGYRRSALAYLAKSGLPLFQSQRAIFSLNPNHAGGSLCERHPKEPGFSSSSASCAGIVVWSKGPNAGLSLKRMRYSTRQGVNCLSEY
jgi:hypothetical protein